MALQQVDLDGKVLKPWQGICVKACWFAKGKVCRCRCHKANHGKGTRALEEEAVKMRIEIGEKQIAEAGCPDNIPPTLMWYESLVPKEKRECRFCGAKLGPMERYDHDGGWPVLGYKERQWLYKVCPKCGYQWALHYLGVPRDAGDPQ